MSTSSKNAQLLRNANLRLCRLRIWSNFQGFGFNLEASIQPPHIIRLVESNSPAAAGGLKILDVILAVNHQDVSEADYNYLRNAIKTARDSNVPVELLVVEQHFYHVLKKKHIPINASSATVMNTPTRMPSDYLNFVRHQPRTCNIRLNKSDTTFGFEVVNGENDVGAYIQEVFPNTPASHTSLRKSDRIIEINDKFVDNYVSKSIIAKLGRAKARGTVKLYVVDTETYKYYQLNKIPLTSKGERINQLEDRFSNERESAIIGDENQLPSSNKSIVRSTLKGRTSSVLNLTQSQRPSEIRRSPSTYLLAHEDSRLCTINRADATDIFDCDLNFHRRERLHSLSITRGRNNRPSYAELAGIKTDDRLIEINGQNIEKLDDNEVIQRIRAVEYPKPSQMLVANVPTYTYHKQKQKHIHRHLSQVEIMPSNTLTRSSLRIARENYDAESSYECDDQDDDQSCRYNRAHSFINDASSYTSRRSTLDVQDDQSTSSFEEAYVYDKSRMTSIITKSSNPSIVVCKGDLITQQTDVIVVCSSSQYLFNSICKAGGNSISDSYNAELKKKSEVPIIAVNAAGEIVSKRIYFLPWKANSDTSILRKSIQKFVLDAVEKAVEEGYRSIAFPAIGCGQFRCSIDLVAQAMVEEAYRKLLMYNISISFVIQPERTDIYDEFQKQINLRRSQSSSNVLRAISEIVGKGRIEVEEGDITMQKVNVIVGSLSSDFLRKAIIRAAGNEVQAAYNIKLKNDPNSIIIATPPGSLCCKQIYFVKWEPAPDVELLQQSLIDLISTVIQNMISHNFNSIAFPAIGCGQHGCSVHVVVKTMIREMKTQLIKRNLPWTVKFIIQSDQPNIYDEFCKEVLATHHDPMELQLKQIPSTWEKSREDKIRFVLSTTSDEYKSIVSNFDQAMKGQYTQIIRIERIQNERWYMQYLAHSEDFKKRLKKDTEKRLYHGCPENAANSIIEDCFNRSFAGANGTAYGVGVYFSSNAAYSHKFTRTNGNGERCMFVARVLIGKTTKGDSSMKTRPVGYDSTTDNDHIFVTYHDAQAFAEYLITYK